MEILRRDADRVGDTQEQTKERGDCLPYGPSEHGDRPLTHDPRFLTAHALDSCGLIRYNETRGEEFDKALIA
jgi:hypothetical protein